MPPQRAIDEGLRDYEEDLLERYGGAQDFSEGETDSREAHLVRMSPDERREAAQEAVQSLLRAYDGVQKAKRPTSANPYLFTHVMVEEDEDGNELSRDDRRHRIPQVSREIQPEVFLALAQMGEGDIARDLILLGRIVRVGPKEGMEALLDLTLPSKEEQARIDDWLGDQGRFETSFENGRWVKKPKKLSYDSAWIERPIPFFDYFARLEDVVESRRVSDFVLRYGAIDALTEHPERFPLISAGMRASRLIDLGREDRIADDLEEFPFVRHRWLFDRLMEGDDLERVSPLAIIRNIDAFRLTRNATCSTSSSKTVRSARLLAIFFDSPWILKRWRRS